MVLEPLSTMNFGLYFLLTRALLLFVIPMQSAENALLVGCKELLLSYKQKAVLRPGIFG